jgi:pimeloyl-ACP methyl ester carboxylesterase
MSYNFRFKGETADLDQQARSSAPGEFVRLSAGFTHYQRGGEKSGVPVILVHGFSVPFYIWDPTFELLVQSRFDVLRYDLYGRGFSDRPKQDYNQDLFDLQLSELIEALGVVGPLCLVALSMGGPISMVYCDRHPGKVAKLCLIDPAGYPSRTTLLTRLLLVPRVGEWLMDRFSKKIILDALTEDFSRPEKFPAYVERAREQMRYKGYRRALLSTIRNGILVSTGEVYSRVGTQEIPTLLIWGKEDKYLPFQLSERIMTAIPHAQFFPVDHAGHLPHYEKPELVNARILEFLRE